jgi:predicted Zn-dependent protease
VSARSWAPATSPVGIRRPLDLCVVLALTLSACALRVSPIGMDGRTFTPEADERRLWAQADKEATALLERVRVHDDPALTAHLTSLARRVTPAGVTAVGGPLPRVVLLRDPTLAAFALPDGRVFVHGGLVAAVESEAQLALVLAREVAHVVRRHALSAQRAGDVGRGRFEVLTHLSPTAGAILVGRLPVAATAAVTGYRAALEGEADTAGLAEVVRGGWDRNDAAAVWAVLARDLSGRGALETFLLGRPAWLEERLQAARELAGAAPAAVKRPGEEFEALRRSLLRDNAGEDARRGRFALARRQLDRVLAAAPTDALAHVQYGELHRLQSQQAATPEERDTELRQARARFTRALALDPTLAEAHRQLGLLAYQQQNLGRARAELEEYLRRAPTAPDAGRIAEYVRELAR